MTNSVRIKQEMLNSSPEDSQTEQVLDLRKTSIEKSCNWCGKKGDFQDKEAHKDFCSEICFDQYRRDSFKKRSACIWCSSTAAQQNVILSASNVDESKFCSAQCLAQFKVRVFCEETSAHLDQLKELNLTEGLNDLITPELWLKKSSVTSKRLTSPSEDTCDSVRSTNSNSASSNGSTVGLSNRSVHRSENSASSKSTAASNSSSASSSFSNVTQSTPFSTFVGTGIGAPPPRKRGRLSTTAMTVSSLQKSPPDNSNSVSTPFNHIGTNSSSSNSNREKESPRGNSKRFGGTNNGNSSYSRGISGRQIHMTPTFPGIVSPLVNKTFQMPNFPLSPHLPNGCFHVDRVPVRADFLSPAPAPPNNELTASSLLPHNFPLDKVSSTTSNSNNNARLGGKNRPHNTFPGSDSNTSYPPIFIVIPVPIPVPIPIPIPLLLGHKGCISKDSEKSDDKAGIDDTNKDTESEKESISNVENSRNDQKSTPEVPLSSSERSAMARIIDIEEND